MDPKLIGERIRELRFRRKLTQGQLAKRAKVAENTIRGLEKASHQTRRAIYLRVVAALGTTPELLERSPEAVTEQHPLLAGLNEDDLKIAQAYSRARTTVRLEVEALLLGRRPEGDRLLLDHYHALNPDRQAAIRDAIALHEETQREVQQRRTTRRSRGPKKP